MGLFSTLGSALGGMTKFFGPMGSAIGKGFGGLLDDTLANRAESKRVEQQNQMEMNKFVRLRKAAERGGFHPLEALRSGQQVSATAGPRLMTSLSRNNAFDALESELTGEAAAQRARQKVDDEIRQRELDRLRYEVAQQNKTTPSIARGRPKLGSGTPSGAFDGNETLADYEDRTAGVTQTGRLGDGTVEDPTQPDVEDLAARHGDAEAFQMIWAFQSVSNRQDYNAALRFAANEMNIPWQELHERIKKNPKLRQALPGRVARIVMNMQGAYDSWGDTTRRPPLQGPTRPPKPTRLDRTMNSATGP